MKVAFWGILVGAAVGTAVGAAVGATGGAVVAPAAVGAEVAAGGTAGALQPASRVKTMITENRTLIARIIPSISKKVVPATPWLRPPV